MTPLIYLKSIVPSTAVRVAPLPGKPIRRMLVVAMRASEGADRLGRIRTAAITAQRDVVQPQIEEPTSSAAVDHGLSRNLAERALALRAPRIS
ncbi:hypothetical protein [Trinickia mobilis]|uniref:hypothetical protein n=1 Tax=Trinickia mobilis TaxID=2816356 RepID=UPI001A8D9FB4|nr:hypothetical protein [Trinickia mobilis]